MDSVGIGSAATFALLLMPFVSLIKKPSWSDKAKQALGLGAALVAAFIGALVDGNVNTWQEAVAYFATARLVAETLYTQYFRGTEANAKLEAIGSA